MQQVSRYAAQRAGSASVEGPINIGLLIKKMRSCGLVLALMMAFSVAGLAQSPTGTVRGTVADGSGAVIAGATVTITNTQTNETKTATSDSEGRYIINFVQPAVYAATASASGFEADKQNNVVVQVSVGSPVDFTLRVAQLSQKVEVTSTTPPLETSTSTVDTVVTSQQITDLPLNGRNPTSLEVLVPGVNTTGGASTPHIAGSRNANNEEQIDGMTNILPENNVGNNSTAYTPIVDSVEEFNVQTSTLPAQYGRFSGGVISLVTRSGTNALHGTFFDFTQTNALYAKNYFSSGPIPDSHLYQYGGTIGGPITLPHVYSGKNKSFFFFAFEDSKQSSNTTETDTVPTIAERSGNFGALGTTIYDPATATAQTITNADGSTSTVYIRNQFKNNIIPMSRFSAVAKAALAYYPAPTNNALVNNYTYTGAVVNNYYHYDLRLDHDFGSKWHSFVRFSHLNNPNTPFADFPGQKGVASQGYGGPGVGGAYSASFDNAITLSPTLVMDLRAGFSRSSENRTAFGGNYNLSALGLPASYIAVAAANDQIFPNFNVGNNGASLGSAGYVPLLENPSAVDVNPSFVKVLHGNSITFGGEFRKLFLNFHQYGYPSGQFGGIDNTWTQKYAGGDPNPGDPQTGNEFATFALGLADYGSITHDTSLATASTYDALYVQDDYQAAKNLTFNIGLRWDVEVPRTERHNKLDYWDPTLPSPIAGLVPANACLYCGNLVGRMVFVGQPGSKYGRHQGPTQWKDFAPRVGFAWSANDKTVVRGGYGLIYQASALQAAGTSGGAGTDGFTGQTNFNFTLDNQQTVNTTFDNPAPTGFNLPKGVAGGPGTFLGQGISDTFFDTYRNPYTIQGNLNIQRALPLQTVVEVGYLYNRGNFLINGDPGVPFSQVDPKYLSLGSKLTTNVANPFYGVITTPGSALAAPTVPYSDLLAPFPQYSGVSSYRKPDSGSHYNAITAKLDKRMSNGLSLLVSFTGSKLMDNASSVVSYLGPTSQTYANQYNPKAEFGLSSQDISRQFVAGYVYELPFGRGKQFLAHENGLIDHLVGGWQTNGVVQWNTGTPIVLGGAQNNTHLANSFSQRPNKAPGDANLAHRTLSQWFNTSLFSQPAPYTIGNAPRVLPNVRVPGYTEADMSAFKNNFFGPSERFNVQFRAEAFNAFNHPVFSGPDTGVNDGNFGLINSQSNTPRQLQLAVKFIY